jgi:hypothetical protein
MVGAPMTDRMDSVQSVSVACHPPAQSWPGLVVHQTQGTLSAQAAITRSELGLANDRPIVLSGHQAGFWHAGILAKWLAAATVAKTINGQSAWIVVDQDSSTCSPIEFPGKESDGQLVLGQDSLFSPTIHQWIRADFPLAVLPAQQPETLPSHISPASADSLRGLRAMRESLQTHASASTIASQCARANADLCTTLLGKHQGSAPTLVYASGLNQTTVFRAMLEMMLEDPLSCAESYNRALATHPQHGLVPLTIDTDRSRIELPLWNLGLGPTTGSKMPRLRVYSHTLSQIPVTQLAPRALLMTGMLRWLACDLFIHGTGGGSTDSDAGYDRVTETWFANWLDATLCPAVVATATITPSYLFDNSIVTLDEIRTARHKAHAAKHTPAILHDAAAHERKTRCLAAIAQQTSRSERAAIYRQMHRELEQYRAENKQRIDQLAAHGAELAELYQAQHVARVRTMPWLVHPRSHLLALRNQLEIQLGVGPDR